MQLTTLLQRQNLPTAAHYSYHHKAMALKSVAVFSPEVPTPLTRKDYLLSLLYGCLCTALVHYIWKTFPKMVQA